MAQEMLLGGQKAIPSKLTQLGFKFEDINIRDFLKKLLK
jgi:NAD dependent epimerase/dehydratase family enzyme